MKKSFLTLVFLALCGLTFAQMQTVHEWNQILSDTPETFRTQLISSSENSIKVNVQVPGFYTTNVTTPRGEAKIVSMSKAVSTAKAGEPNVPMTGIPAIIGDHARMGIRVIDAQYMDFEGIEVAPSKGDFPRTVDPATVPYTYGACYSQDAFFPANNVGLYEPYIIRDFRGQNMVVYPYAYNPVTKTLRVYYDMTVEMYKVDNNGSNVMETRRSNTIKMDPDFKSMYQRHFINYQAAMNRYTPVDEEGDLLIICYDNFISSMTDFINWKKTRGINTTIVGTSTAGSTYSAIKTYIQNQYNANNNLTHVLLVGDVAQIPGYTYTGGGPSYSGKGDNAYGQIVGSDIYNDVFIGRFSANTTARVTTQCNRVITYERDLNTSATWLKVGEGISRKENGSGHNGEDDYQHMNNIRTDLLNYGYTPVYQRYANLSGYDGSSATISSDINSGVGIINYANHGLETAWGANYSGYIYYTNSNVNALTNENKLPFIWSVACLVGKYDHSSDCFAEAWMNATNNNNPTGAIGTLMSYIEQPWIPPMWAQDECVDILVESYSSNTKHTWGGTSINGLMSIFDHYSTSTQSAVGTYQAWILYGDPSLMLRTKIPTAMTIIHAGTIDPLATSYSLSVSNGDGALATITDANHTILGRATVSNGIANVSISGTLTPNSELTLCVFGYNMVTYLGTISVNGNTQYTVDAMSSPTEGGTVSGAGSYLQGETCSLTAMPNEGYTFVNWTENGIQVSDTLIYSFTVTSNRTLIANFTGSQGTITQTSTFSQGYNWWSTCIEQEGIDGLGMLQDGLGSNGVTIRSQASGYTDYYSEYGWYGSLTSINNESSYRVITNAPCTVTMTGNVAVPSQHPITLGQGWTWIGYVPSTAMDVNVAMAGLTPTYGDKLKSQQGYSDYYGEDYGWFGSLNTIEPGMGLMYYSTNGEAVTFTYPDGNKGGELKKNLTSENNHWKPNTHAYPDNMTVMAVVEIDDVELTSDNYELAAFAANGECRGCMKLTYAEPLHRHVAFLTISGKEAAELSFRLYDTETNEEYYDAEESLNFVANAIVGEADDLYTIHFRSTTGMDELAKSVQVYPNPVNAGERFSINITNDEKSIVRAEIVNALGIVIEVVCSPSLQTITAPNISGVYTLRITVEGEETIIRKLVVK